VFKINYLRKNKITLKRYLKNLNKVKAKDISFKLSSLRCRCMFKKYSLKILKKNGKRSTAYFSSLLQGGLKLDIKEVNNMVEFSITNELEINLIINHKKINLKEYI
jgi:hypothetical protein